MKGVLKKVLVTLMIIVALTSTGILVAYYYIDANNLWPKTLTSAHAGTIVDETGKEYPFIEINYYEDVYDKGDSLFEICFNFYMNVEDKNVRTYAMQLLNPPKSYELNQDGTMVETGKFISTANPKVYERYKEGSWGAITELEYGKNAYPMIFELDGARYAFFLDGTYTARIDTLPNTIWGDIARGADDFFFGDQSYIEDIEVEYNYNDFFKAAYMLLTRNSFGEGDYTMPIVNIAEYFSLGVYNENTKQFDALPETSHVYTTSELHGHYSQSNVRYARQSLINQIEGDGDWTFDSGELQDYSKLQFEKNISINDFEMRYSEADGGYWLTLPKELIGDINRAGDFVVNINLNLDNTTNKILGFDFYAIDGLAVNNLTISASTPQDFILKPSWNANSTIKNTTHPNITIIDKGGAQ